ncbi:MAG: hypothetical protein EBX40_02145 [Gammaproteobacteria bacterium]|nr:hypothetical protein [Gammaproteobacteria bacterium]
MIPPIVVQYFEDKRFRGLPESKAGSVFLAKAGSLSQGVLIELGVTLLGDKISSCGFRIYGSGYMVATMAWVCEQINQRPLNFLATIGPSCIVEALQLPPEKTSCALLAEDVLKQLMDITPCMKMKN